jgi:hypothetical protein
MTTDEPKSAEQMDELANTLTNVGGEDESSTEQDGRDDHLHDDQKAPTLPTAEPDEEKENDPDLAA